MTTEEQINLSQTLVEYKSEILLIEDTLKTLDFKKLSNSLIFMDGCFIFQYQYLDQPLYFSASIALNLSGVTWEIDGFTKDTSFPSDIEEAFNYALSESKKTTVQKQLVEERPSDCGYVYMMKNNLSGRIKIGKSLDPKFRERTLQSQEPDVNLIWKLKVKRMSEFEEKLHRKYSAKRVRGEWFDLDEEDVKAIMSCRDKYKK